MKAWIKAFVHKKEYRGQKYLVVLGLRFPYEVHIEEEESCRKKYIRILGMEFCYKRMPPRPDRVNSNTEFTYIPNENLMAFQMEDKITEQIQRIHCEQKAYEQLGYFPNLKNPQTLNEKIIWLAMHYKNPDIALASNKATAKEWIRGRIGEGYVFRLLGVYEDVSDIDFSALPDRFVAKLNNGWGADRVMIVRDKRLLDIDRAKAILSSWLYPWNNYYYKNMCITDEKMPGSTIVIEEYMDGGENGLNDYKFYCCNGEPRFALVVNGRAGNHQTRSFVDVDWNVLPFARRGMSSTVAADKPVSLDEMLRLCRKLAAGFPFVRIDFYELDGKPYVGEMTFTPGMFMAFSEREWDEKLGEYLVLPTLQEKD